MALDKIKTDVIADDAVTGAKVADDAVGIEHLSSTTGVKADRHSIPSIITSERDAGSFNATSGDLIFNSTIGKLQQYDGNNAWATIDSPPVISSITYPTESGAVLTALDASGGSDAAQTLIINGSNFSETSGILVQIQVSGSYVTLSSSLSVNGAGNQITCTGVTKRAAADGYTIKVTNVSGLSATTTVNFSADPSFSTAASLGTVYTGDTLNKSIAFTGTAVLQGATTKPTWMTVTGNSPSGSDANGAGVTTFLATGTPAVLGGTTANTGTVQTHTFSIIVRDAENQTFNRDYSLIVTDPPNVTSGNTSTAISGYKIIWFLTDGSIEFYASSTIDYLIIGGGGSGGKTASGGGGAGGVRTATGLAVTAQSYSIVVGDGGAAITSSSTAGNNGDPSSGFGLTAAGGGGGAGGSGSGAGALAKDGGSGGGGAHSTTTTNNAGGDGINDASTFGSATFQGYDGGASTNNQQNYYPGAGGGGAGVVGADIGGSTDNWTAGAGGNGISQFWGMSQTDTTAVLVACSAGVSDGTYRYLAGGGAGSTDGGTGAGAIGGKGGGGEGGCAHTGSPREPAVGVANTGSGSGGADHTHNSKTGGSGIVVIRYAV
jgi:hypothetical protein